MKDKGLKMAVLRGVLEKYCKQLGIVDCEVPQLLFDGAEFKRLNNEAHKRLGIKPSAAGGHSTRMYGYCSFAARLIFINLNTRNRTLKQLRHDLAHELVHYRFHSLNHGKEYEERIVKVLRGKSYKRKHIRYPQYARMI